MASYTNNDVNIDKMVVHWIASDNKENYIYRLDFSSGDLIH
jgi:hypothetical protein